MPAAAPLIRLNHDQIAKLAHETLRTACVMFYDSPPAPWADASDMQRRSVTSLVARLQEEPGLTPEAFHERWRLGQVAEGWRYGAMRNTADKTNPMLVPWADLSPKYRTKQALVFAIVGHLLRPDGAP